MVAGFAEVAERKEFLVARARFELTAFGSNLRPLDTGSGLPQFCSQTVLILFQVSESLVVKRPQSTRVEEPALLCGHLGCSTHLDLILVSPEGVSCEYLESTGGCASL